MGAATAGALGGLGAHVVLTARTTGGLEEVEEHIHAAGGSATIAPLDLTEAESITRLAEAVAGRWGKLDILVMNAAMLGTLSPGPHIDHKELDRLIALNLVANQRLLSAIAPLLRKGASPRVLPLHPGAAQAPPPHRGGP